MVKHQEEGIMGCLSTGKERRKVISELEVGSKLEAEV